MFEKIFKKKEQPEQNVVSEVLENSSSKYPLEVQQIHHEFEIAADKLLKKANEIINSQPVINKSKVDRLSKFGFTQVKEAVEAAEVGKVIELSQSQIDLVNYYKKNYPFYKFIAENQVKTICHKYNLVCGDVSRFRGFVPEKNLKDIENFKLKKEEENTIYASFLPYGSNRSSVPTELCFKNAEVSSSIGSYFHIYPKGSSKYTDMAFQSDDGIEFYGNDGYNTFGYKHLGSGRFTLEESVSLKICAPVKDMDISGLELKEGYKLERKIEIPDPVVLKKVKGGYLIVTAWGDEASDPLVMNETHN